MLEQMTVEQLNHWRIFYSMEPFGEMREDLRIGTLTSLIANTNRDPKKRARPFKPDDFFPSLADKAKQKAITGERKPMMAADWSKTRGTLVSLFGG